MHVKDCVLLFAYKNTQEECLLLNLEYNLDGVSL